MTTSTEGITLLGSEMLTWSDADGAVGAFGGLLAPRLLHGFGGRRERALVAGPTTADVVRDVAAHFGATDVLVRSWPDAQRLREELPDAIGVLCGPLDRLAGRGASYDAVVAVAGTDRLHSAEEETPTADAVLADLVALLTADGELFVGVGNAVGVDRLLAAGDESRHSDADWPDGHVVDRPTLDAGAVAALLQERHGLTSVETWCCHGRRSDPLVAASATTLTDGRTDEVVIREVTAAYDVDDPAALPLKDPHRTVHDLVVAGLGAAVAPLTVLHLRRGAASEPDPGAGTVLVQEPGHDGAPAIGYRLTRRDGAWERELLGEAGVVTVAPGLVRDTAALAGPVPEGPTLAAALEACCAAHDASAAGVLVRRLRDWLGAAPDADVPVDRVALLPRTLVLSGDDLVPLDPSWRAETPAPRDVVLLRGLLDVSAALLARGVRHPWSPGASPWVLASALATAAGIEDVAALRDPALALEARLRPAGTAPDYDAPASTGRLSYAELAEAAEVLAVRAADADEHVLWLLRRLQGRQRALRKTRGQLNALNTSREVRVGRKIFWVRDKLRRRRLAQEAAAEGPVGEWKDRNPDAPVEPLEVEKSLLPPGYRVQPEVTVIPDEPI
ncbi:hypothetical protein [Marmoricola sp. RAF53]|uniref:hypothetical protein n=1 Tax=Marmoricola sp. RAF53 TaxID=3233059 RepID=UPI003F9848F4